MPGIVGADKILLLTCPVSDDNNWSGPISSLYCFNGEIFFQLLRRNFRLAAEEKMRSLQKSFHRPADKNLAACREVFDFLIQYRTGRTFLGTLINQQE
jgi:hypothetical protein